ncbi:MAG: chemotaxis protein CheB [Caldimonas sp.]
MNDRQPPGPGAAPSPDPAEEGHAEQHDNVVPGARDSRLPMVGLGGSAGAIAALQAFFKAMPADTGMAFVVVMHLSAEHDSSLAQILGRSTEMPVLQVNATVPVQANHVYVIPPGKALQSANGHLTVAPLELDRGHRVAVDLFFRTLADTHGPRATAIILSGADGDGAIGLKRVKERGGLTIAQDPDEAEFDSMPRSAIATGMVDWVLRVADMPAKVHRYHELLPRLKLPPEEGTSLAAAVAAPGEDLEAALREVLAFLRTQTGRDFSNYKRATVLRRLARRMSVNGIEDLRGYLAFMRTSTGEPAALLKDLLISVTHFFRDREAFDAFAAQVPALFAGKASNDALRVWVAGCASGEEAYSIAMLLVEHARRLEAPPAIQIFATDLDEDAVRIGREAVYPTAIAADVSQERLRRFFTKDARGWRVRSELRETVLFASHDLLRDSPFSRLDLVSCRNVLIYMNREAQGRAFDTLHFALRPGGRIFLGTSETVDVREELFAPVDKKHRLYEARAIGRKLLAPAAGTNTLARALDVRTAQADAHSSLASAAAHPTTPSTWARPHPGDLGLGSWRELHLKLIERVAPASIVITDAYVIVHLSESAGRFLRFSAGEPALDLVGAVDPALSADLLGALMGARESTGPVETAPIPYSADGRLGTVTIRVARADDVAAGFLLVTFELRFATPDAANDALPPTAADDRSRRLSQQIEQLQAHLRDVTERGETAAQELKANNEELQAMNEELRSATEELETSREELHSINEELTTVNQELKSNVDDLSRANVDLQNLMASTAIATVFLDRDLKITLFTPQAIPLFNLIAADVGRPLSDLAHRLDYPQMSDDARRVLADLVPIEREVGAPGRAFLARVLPYRSQEDRIAGVVFTFLDITVRKAAEEALRESELQFRTIVSQAAAGVAHLDLAGALTLVNPRFCEIAGYPEAALQGTSVFDLVHANDQQRHRAAFGRLVADGTPFEMDERYVRRDGEKVWVSTAVTATLDADGRPTAAIAIVLDITNRRQADQALRESEERLRLVLENAREYAIIGMDLRRCVTSWNTGAERLLGFSEAEIIGRPADVIFVEEDRAAGVPDREARGALEAGRAADERWHLRKDGSRFWGSGAMMAMRDGDQQVLGLLKIMRDQTAVRAAQDALELSRAELVEALVDNRRARAAAETASQAKDRFLAILSHELRTPLTPVVMALHALERTPDLPASARSTLQIIQRNVQAELHLIDDLLDVTRISAGKLEMVREATDMHQVIRSAAEVCESDFIAKRQRLHLALRAPSAAVRGDSQRLRQVVWNLLKNAAKFTPPGGEIRVGSENVNGRFVFTVSDTGIGIEPAALATIFDAFAQEGPWVTTEFGGLGLGLAIANSTVEAHSGSLRASSEGRDRGATFTVELPGE